MTTILMHIQRDADSDERLEVALALTRACAAHLHCVHVTPIEAYSAFEGLGGVFVVGEVMDALQQQDEETRSDLERKLSNEDVTWDFVQVTGHVAQSLIRYAALADLVVTGRESHPDSPLLSTLPHFAELLFRSRTPLYIPSSGRAPSHPTAKAVIAWDGSAEAANTVRQSLTLLKKAESVEVLTAIEDGKEHRFPSTQLLKYLSRHGMHANLQTLEAQKDEIPPTLVEKAIELGGSYLLMGGYHHSRLGEYLFGGVTRTLLASSPVPLVIGR